MVLVTFTTSLYGIYTSLSITTIIVSTYALLSNYRFKAIQQITQIACTDTVKKELGIDQEQQEQHCPSPSAKEDLFYFLFLTHNSYSFYHENSINHQNTKCILTSVQQKIPHKTMERQRNKQKRERKDNEKEPLHFSHTP